ncbi:uncharacterized protein [Hyperolius riggenbachi]|uniref:uncharacterized protein isoform X2 n=1 Tax=Hyperolius riggenbachi TaxID=752182 RepID=UPI0035A347E1
MIMTRLVIVNIFYLLLNAHVMADLKVTIGTSPIPTLRGENVTIPCNITSIDDKKPIRVEWKKTLENGTEKVVHDYEGGRMTAHREGSYMDVEEILKGNAELYLPNIQISDDGEYTCNVTNTPRYASSKTDLQVSVLPHVMTTLNHVSTKHRKETSLTCEVTNFYPQTMTIRWVRYNKDSPGYVVLEEQHTDSPIAIANSDGTFNMTSHLTLRSVEADDEGSYGCIVKLRDFKFVNNIAVPEKSKIGLIAVPMTVAFVILMGILGSKGVAPTLSDITGNEELMHMLRTTLTFQVMKYRPAGLTVSVGLRRPGQQEEETIITCKTSDKIITGVVTAKGEEHPLQPELCLFITKDKYNVCCCECSLSITPSYEDNGAEISVHVTHRKLKSPISVQRILKVARGLPVLGMITSDPTIGEYGKPLTLNWHVTGCDLNNITKVTWADGGGKPVKGIQNETRGPGESLDCTLMITPTAEDYGRIYTCSVHYKDIYIPFTRNVTLRLPVPEHQTHNNENVPSVCINDELHQHNEKNSHHEKEKERNSSHSFISSLTFTPTVNKDDGMTTNYGTFHPATQTEAEKELTIRPTAFPQLDEIQKKQEVVYFGEELNLSCGIHTFNPADMTVTWYVDDSLLPSERSEPIQEPNTGLYHVTTNVRYIPTTFEWKTFRCEVQQGTAEPTHVTWTLKDLSFPSQRI